MQAIGIPRTPFEANFDMLQRAKTRSCTEGGSIPRPLSQATETFETDFEDESDFEEYSPKGSFESVSHTLIITKRSTDCSTGG